MSISNSDDIIDSRDIITRIEELETEIEDALADAEEDENNKVDLSQEQEELKALKELAEEASGYSSDWQYGCTLIRESNFEDYARQLAEDIGAIDRDANWPNNHIDWEAAADELRIDYTEVDFDGVTYLIR